MIFVLSGTTMAQRPNGKIIQIISSSSGILRTHSGAEVPFYEPLLTEKHLTVNSSVSYSSSLVENVPLATGLNLITENDNNYLMDCQKSFLIPTGTEIIYVNESKIVFNFPEGWFFVFTSSSGDICSAASVCHTCLCESSSGNCKVWTGSGGRWGCTMLNGCEACCGTTETTANGLPSDNDADYIRSTENGVVIDRFHGIQFVFNEKINEIPDGDLIQSENYMGRVDWKELPPTPKEIFQIQEVIQVIKRLQNSMYHCTPDFITNHTIAPCDQFKYVSIYFFGYAAMIAMRVDDILLPALKVIANGGDVSTCECAESSGCGGDCTYEDVNGVTSCTPNVNCRGCRMYDAQKFDSHIPDCK